jgi:hypothetical protein
LPEKRKLARSWENPLGFHPQYRFVRPHMGNCKGKDNVKKRKARRMKNDRLQAAKKATKAKA